MTRANAITSLKLYLGRAGRGDFETVFENLLGDLFYVEERLVVVVKNCLWLGCSDHGSPPLAWNYRIRQNKKEFDAGSMVLEQKGWTAFRIWQHRLDSLRSVVVVGESILENLKGIKEDYRWDAMTNRARLINADAMEKIGLESWREFLEVVGGAPARTLRTFVVRRADVKTYLEMQGWEIEKFRAAWNTALHHEVLVSDSNGVRQGRYFLEVCREAQVSPEVLKKAKEEKDVTARICGEDEEAEGGSDLGDSGSGSGSGV